MVKNNFISLFIHLFVGTFCFILFLIGNFLLFNGDNQNLYIFYNFGITLVGLAGYYFLGWFLFNKTSFLKSFISTISFPIIGVLAFFVLNRISDTGLEWIVFSGYNTAMMPSIFLILKNLPNDTNLVLLLSLIPPTLFTTLGIYSKK